MKADIYYNRSLKFWTLLWKDDENNQIGHAEYYNSKMEANHWANKGFNQFTIPQRMSPEVTIKWIE